MGCEKKTESIGVAVFQQTDYWEQAISSDELTVKIRRSLTSPIVPLNSAVSNMVKCGSITPMKALTLQLVSDAPLLPW